MTDPDIKPPGTPTDWKGDALGQALQGKWHQWSTLRRQVEEEWLKDLRSFNQIPDPAHARLSTYHAHVHTGLARSRALTAHSRVVDPMFQQADPHWEVAPTPLPETAMGDAPELKPVQDEMARRARAMGREMADQLVSMGYEDKVKAAMLEACILGTGVVKGVIPGVKVVQRWRQVPFVDGHGMMFDEDGRLVLVWDLVDEEQPYPSMGGGCVSVFDVYPDPYATDQEGMQGCFERHVLNRGQFEELTSDPQFDADKVRAILAETAKGNHSPLWHETERRAIAGVMDTTGAFADRIEVLEYWGQVSGRDLKSCGFPDFDPDMGGIDESATYWCNVWACSGRAILAKRMPMKRQRIPYQFFPFQRIPHQFWGIGPVRMARTSVDIQNASIRAMCDNLAVTAIPMREVNVNMLRDGEDPRAIGPGHVFVRDSGDPAEPAIRWYNAPPVIDQIIKAQDVSRRLLDDETNLPSYMQGLQIKGAGETASGTSMLMGAANVSIKTVVRNLEDFLIRPLLKSLFDWNMEWSEREDIKGDMDIQVKAATMILAREVQSQRLASFISLVSSPALLPYVDMPYLLKEAAMAMEIDPGKAVPDGQAPSAMPPQAMLTPGMEGGGVPAGRQAGYPPQEPGELEGGGAFPFPGQGHGDQVLDGRQGGGY